MAPPATLLLLRTHKFDEEIRRFAESLAALPGMSLACLVDESLGEVATAPYPKIPVTRGRMEALGLHCPGDFAWRCGDYGFYEAARLRPESSHIWMVEYDVRFSMASPSDFFAAFRDRSDLDLIAPNLGERDRNWFWHPAMTDGRRPVYGCIFPCIRLSSRAVAAALDGRRRASRSWLARTFWPNDESFVATTLVRDGFSTADLNDLGRTFYTDDSFSFTRPFELEAFERQPMDGLLYHPVLKHDDYVRKLNRLAPPVSFQERVQRKVRLALAPLVTTS